MVALFELLRPKQWVKNIFVIAPLVFSYSFFDLEKIGFSLLAFGIFCVFSSSVYVVNDILDVAADRVHPVKRNRPLARHALSLPFAWIVAVALGMMALGAAYLLSPYFFAVTLSYLFLNILYSVWLKHLFLLDMFSVAMGFVLRVLGGVAAISVAPTPWILGATFFLSLFIVTVKRMQELRGAGSGEQRSVLSLYSVAFLREIRFVALVLTIAVFIFYSFSEVRSLLFLVAILPVLYGVFRFLWLSESGSVRNDNPTDMLFQDVPMQAAIIVFVLLVTSIFALRFTSYAGLLFFFPQ